MDTTENVALDLSMTGRRTYNYSENSPEEQEDIGDTPSEQQKEAEYDFMSSVYRPLETIKTEDSEDDLQARNEVSTPPSCKRPRYSDPDLAIQNSLNESVHVSDTGYECDGGPIYRTIDGITVYLHDEALWHAFSKCGTEMIISRGGRRMFPHIVLSFDGLTPDKWYSLTLEIQTADDRRYKYINNQWMAMGMADPSSAVQPIPHSDSPNTGAYWTQNRVSFSKVRLTNNKEASSSCPDGNILLLSMHKYVAVIKLKDESCPGNAPLEFRFDDSTFIAVTAYQNYKITHLKIKNNPFAKAFRDANNSSGNRPATTRRKESMSKYNVSASKEESTRRPVLLPPPIPSFSPLYYPYPGLQLRQFGSEFPFDSLTAGTMSNEHLARMSYLSWMANSEHIQNTWLKNTGHMFDINQFMSRRALEKSKDKLLDDDDDNLKDNKCSYVDIMKSEENQEIIQK